MVNKSIAQNLHFFLGAFISILKKLNNQEEEI